MSLHIWNINFIVKYDTIYIIPRTIEYSITPKIFMPLESAILLHVPETPSQDPGTALLNAGKI